MKKSPFIFESVETALGVIQVGRPATGTVPGGGAAEWELAERKTFLERPLAHHRHKTGDYWQVMYYWYKTERDAKLAILHARYKDLSLVSACYRLANMTEWEAVKLYPSPILRRVLGLFKARRGRMGNGQYGYNGAHDEVIGGLEAIIEDAEACRPQAE